MSARERERVAVAVFVLAAGWLGFAQAPAEPRHMLLWENRAPGALGMDAADRPAITFYAPTGRGGSGTAVIVAPGGGYGALAMNHEGRQVANWLNATGVSAFVLQYRLGPAYRHPTQLGDAARAMRIVRARASEFNIQPDRIGIMGFSAGGHLASTLATHLDAGDAGAADVIDRVSSRPDFLVLGYPVITSKAPYAHQGPTFLFHTNADTGVPAENSVLFYLALRRAGVPAELHVFEPGPHGVGLAMNDPVLERWPALLSNWMRARGLLTAPVR